MAPGPLRIGTRGSPLALAQARSVAALLDGRLAAPPSGGPAVEVVTIATAGDRGARGGDKSRWVDAIEEALAAGAIDLAVHSAKDVPGDLADGLALLGAPPRAAAEDVVCLASAAAPEPGPPEPGPPEPGPPEPGPPELGPDGALALLAPGARVGTSSVRRAAQLRAVRGDLKVVAVRGNLDTRLRKLGDPGEGLDALVVARAGLQRLGRAREVGAVLDPARFVPAPGQGTLALEGRADDEAARTAAHSISDARTFACLRAERAVAHALGATCHTPLGAHALDAGCGCLHLRAWVGLPDGSAWVADELVGGFYDPEPLGRRVAERMASAGAGELLRAAEELAGQTT
jgi:hydroxymethylbilane synthase